MKCKIQWIENGEITPDDNDAVGVACCTFFDKEGKISEIKKFPICAEHLKKMPTKPNCWDGRLLSVWNFEEFTKDDY